MMMLRFRREVRLDLPGKATPCHTSPSNRRAELLGRTGGNVKAHGAARGGLAALGALRCLCEADAVVQGEAQAAAVNVVQQPIRC